MFVKAKGEIKLTFSSTLGAGGTANGVERTTTKIESPEVRNGSAVPTSPQDDLGDPDDIVSEFLGQINHAAAAAAAAAASDGTSLVADPGQSPTMNGFIHDGSHMDRCVDGDHQRASFTYEPGSKVSNYGSGVDAELLPVGMTGQGGGDMGGGPAAETLKKMAALHRRLEEKTGSGSAANQLLSTSDYEGAYVGGRHALYAVPYQLPASYCAGNSNCGMLHSAGATKPLSHYPAAPAAVCGPEVTFHQYGNRTHEPDVVGAGDTGSSFYMSQSQCANFRLSHPVVHARAATSQSAALRSASTLPYRSPTPNWTRAVGYPYPQSRYPSADERGGWISSTTYGRPDARDPTAPTTGSGSENRSRVFHGYQQQSFCDGALQPPPAYSDYMRHKQRLQFDRKWNQPTVTESRWRRRRPWIRHQDFDRVANPGVAVTPAPAPASGHVTFADVEFPVADEFFSDQYSNANVVSPDSSFIDDILFSGP